MSTLQDHSVEGIELKSLRMLVLKERRSERKERNLFKSCMAELKEKNVVTVDDLNGHLRKVKLSELVLFAISFISNESLPVWTSKQNRQEKRKRAVMEEYPNFKGQNSFAVGVENVSNREAEVDIDSAQAILIHT